MSRPVRFVSDVPALCYDPQHQRVIKVARGVDRKGRVWESYDDGPYVPIELPEEPRAKRVRKHAGNSKK